MCHGLSKRTSAVPWARNHTRTLHTSKNDFLYILANRYICFEIPYNPNWGWKLDISTTRRSIPDYANFMGQKRTSLSLLKLICLDPETTTRRWSVTVPKWKENPFPLLYIDKLLALEALQWMEFYEVLRGAIAYIQQWRATQFEARGTCKTSLDSLTDHSK